MRRTETQQIHTPSKFVGPSGEHLETTFCSSVTKIVDLSRLVWCQLQCDVVRLVPDRSTRYRIIRQLHPLLQGQILFTRIREIVLNVLACQRLTGSRSHLSVTESVSFLTTVFVNRSFRLCKNKLKSLTH